MSKFQLYCSCITCKAQLTAQNIKSHYKKYHSVNEPKSYCLECQKPIYTNNKFCNQSCSAKHNNKKRLESGWVPSKTQRLKTSLKLKLRYPKFTPVTPCIICNKLHPRSGKTCSNNCYRIHQSIRMKDCIANGDFNPNKNRGRHKRSYMELSFENWLNENFPSLKFITEHPFHRSDITKTYFADFYFPDLSLIIELDGTQHLLNVNYDIERDEYIKSHYNVSILRISHREYKEKLKLDIVKELLSK